MSDYKNPGGYKYNGRKMNSGYANNVRAEIAKAEADMLNTRQRPQRYYNNERDGIAINPVDSIVAAGLVIGVVGFCLYWVKGWMNGWASYDLPWNFIAGYYNIIFGWTIDTFPSVWGWLKTTINTPIAVVGIVLYGLLVLSIYIKIYITIMFRVAGNMNAEQGWMLLSNLLLMPLFLGGLFSLVRGVFRWLF